ncbi:MAG: 1-acyl-sn-glycerol-3-phosphate acyltransferase [Bacteroidales bacterium]|nr:1-acyl-sn-glycerol-3-phosphate acyltransferase [Bacteroidales bacterium]
MKKVNAFLLRLLRYKIDTKNVPTEAKKCVLLFAPHTSMLDFVIGKMALTAMGVKTLFIIKKEAFFFPLGLLLKALGGVPLDRKHAGRFHLYAAELIKVREEVALLIAPEGTRNRNPRWKKGFYSIAQEAGVPIALGYLDYRSRKGGIGKMFYPTSDYDKDLATIKMFYHGMRGRYKGHFDLEDLPYSHPEWLENHEK